VKTQPALFDVPAELATTAPYQGHSETSRAAAEGLGPVVLQAKQVAVLRRLAEQPSTDNDLIDYFRGLEWSVNTPRARRVDLTKAGLVEDSGEVSKGCAVWRCSYLGKAALLALDRTD
jgi:hypothetical protein